MPAAAILDEGCLQRRLHPHHFGEVYVTLELLLSGTLDVEIFEAVTVQHHHAGFFRVGGIDQHNFGHQAVLSDGPSIGARPSQQPKAGQPTARAGDGEDKGGEAGPIAGKAGKLKVPNPTQRPPAPNSGRGDQWSRWQQALQKRSCDPIDAIGCAALRRRLPRWKSVPTAPGGRSCPLVAIPATAPGGRCLGARRMRVAMRWRTGRRTRPARIAESDRTMPQSRRDRKAIVLRRKKSRAGPQQTCALEQP